MLVICALVYSSSANATELYLRCLDSSSNEIDGCELTQWIENHQLEDNGTLYSQVDIWILQKSRPNRVSFEFRPREFQTYNASGFKIVTLEASNGQPSTQLGETPLQTIPQKNLEYPDKNNTMKFILNLSEQNWTQIHIVISYSVEKFVEPYGQIWIINPLRCGTTIWCTEEKYNYVKFASHFDPGLGKINGDLKINAELPTGKIPLSPEGFSLLNTSNELLWLTEYTDSGSPHYVYYEDERMNTEEVPVTWATIGAIIGALISSLPGLLKHTISVVPKLIKRIKAVTRKTNNKRRRKPKRQRVLQLQKAARKPR